MFSPTAAPSLFFIISPHKTRNRQFQGRTHSLDIFPPKHTHFIMSDSEVDDYAMSQDESDGYEPEATKKVPCQTHGATKHRISVAA